MQLVLSKIGTNAMDLGVVYCSKKDLLNLRMWLFVTLRITSWILYITKARVSSPVMNSLTNYYTVLSSLWCDLCQPCRTVKFPITVTFSAFISFLISLVLPLVSPYWSESCCYKTNTVAFFLYAFYYMWISCYSLIALLH